MVALLGWAPACSSAPPPPSESAPAPAAEVSQAPSSEAPSSEGSPKNESRTSAGVEQRVAGDPDPTLAPSSAEIASSPADAAEKASDVGLPDAERELVGKWYVDIESTMAADARFQSFSDETKKAAIEIAKERLGEVTMEFTRSGKMIATFNGKKEEGTYVVKKAEGNRLILGSTSKSGKDEELAVEVKNKKLRVLFKGQTLFFKKRQASGAAERTSTGRYL